MPENVKITPKKLASEVSRDTGVPYQTSLMVVERVFDILLEQIVNNDSTTVTHLFSVRRLTKRSCFKDDPNPQMYLSLRTARSLRSLFAVAKSQPDKEFLVNRNTWRAALKWYKSTKSGENGRVDLRPEDSTHHFFAPSNTGVDDDFVNPILEDD